MRICAAPTIFDHLEREKIIAWLEQEPTISLIAELDLRISEVTRRICEISGRTDAEIATAYIAARSFLDSLKIIRDWMTQAISRVKEGTNAKA